jgi:AraC-like DNA-binding protein
MDEKAFRRCGEVTLLYRPPREVHAQQFHGAGARCVTFEPPPGWLSGTGAAAEDGVDLRGWPTMLALRLYLELRRPGAAGAVSTTGLARELFAATAARIALTRRSLPGWFRHARQRLGEGGAGVAGIGAMAAVAGVHRVHFNRAFHRAYRHPVSDLVRHLRVEAACRAIVRGDGTLSRIAAETGFSDHSHMTRVFRRSLGVTPRGLRDVTASTWSP